MSCFCRKAVTELERRAAQLEGTPPNGGALTGSASPVQTSPVQTGTASTVRQLSHWLAASAQPAPPWQPQPEWRDLRLPMPKLSEPAVNTISTLVHLHMMTRAQFGIDLLQPGQAVKLARVVATLNHRLAGSPVLQTLDPRRLVQLASHNDALDHVRAADRLGLLKPVPEQQAAMAAPGGVPLRQWAPLLAPLRRLAPLLAAARQLGVPVDDTAPLAAALRELARLTLPALTEADTLHRLCTALSAVRRLRDSLGLDPLTQDFHALEEKVQQKGRVLAQIIAQKLGPQALAMPPERLAEILPKLPMAPGALANEPTVALAQQADKLAEVEWKVPDHLPAVPAGLMTCTFTAQLTALGLSAVQEAPCGQECDAAALMRAA